MLDLLPDLGAELGSGLRVLQHNEARIVARKRPEHFRDVQLVDCGGGAVCKTGHGLDDDHVLCVVHARDALPEDQVQLGGEGMLRRLGRGRIAVNTVWAKLLDDAQLLDVAGMVACVVEKPASFSSASSCSCVWTLWSAISSRIFSWRFDFIDVFTSFFQ